VNWFLSSDLAFRLVLGMQAICIGLVTAELLYCGELTAPHSFHSLRHLAYSGRLSTLIAKWCSIIPICLYSRLLSSLWLIAAVFFNDTILGPLLVICVSTALIAVFRIIGSNGAEQMCLITIIAAVLTVVAGNTSAHQNVFLMFVAGQSALSYFTSGIAKLISPVWRSGKAISKVAATSSYGAPWFYRITARSSFLGYVLCWSTILFEILFPTALLGIEKLSLVLMTMGIAFHLGCAVIMGFNDFVWAFVGTYPAVFYVSRQIGAAIW